MRRNFMFLLISVVVVMAVISSIFVMSSRTIGPTASAETIDSHDMEHGTTEGKYELQERFPIGIKQADNIPFRIIDASVDVIRADHFNYLTGQRALSPEVVSKPRVVFRNVSDKTVVSVFLMIYDDEAGTMFGIIRKETNIKPGQTFNMIPASFVPASKEPARNPKFWMTAKDKSKIRVSAGATFEDGTKWVQD